jgi:malate dehydrogenase (oxaloacetate-decarboxylating)
MCRVTSRPLILPVSMPAAAIEAMPSDVIAWSGGRALIAAGIPADPVEYNGTTFAIAQADSALIYPGLGLGVIVSQSQRVTPHMLQAAAIAIAEQTDTSRRGAPLLPGAGNPRAATPPVTEAVIRAAVADQVAAVNPTNPREAIRDATWLPVDPDPD